MKKFQSLILVSIVVFAISCKKDDSDTSLGTPINQVRQLEVFIDGSEWESDDVYTETLFGNLKIIGNDDESQFDISIENFSGPDTYFIDNSNTYIRYYEDVSEPNNYYFGQNDSIIISSYTGGDPVLIGSFSFTGINSTGGSAKEFTEGMFNGVDSISNVPTEILSIILNQAPWEPRSVEVSENSVAGTLTMLAQSGEDNTFVVIRIPTTTSPGTYALNDPNFTIEYQIVDGETFTANSGQLVITENDFFNSSLIGSFEDVTLTDPITSGSVFLSGNFNLQYE